VLFSGGDCVAGEVDTTYAVLMINRGATVLYSTVVVVVVDDDDAIAGNFFRGRPAEKSAQYCSERLRIHKALLLYTTTGKLSAREKTGTTTKTSEPERARTVKKQKISDDRYFTVQYY